MSCPARSNLKTILHVRSEGQDNRRLQSLRAPDHPLVEVASLNKTKNKQRKEKTEGEHGHLLEGKVGYSAAVTTPSFKELLAGLAFHKQP